MRGERVSFTSVSYTHLYVYLNGMRIISYAAEASAGAVGYKTQTGVEYTAFTNDVFGTSDFEAVKNFPTKFPATAYLKGENRGFSIAGAERESGGLRVGEKQLSLIHIYTSLPSSRR